MRKLLKWIVRLLLVLGLSAAVVLTVSSAFKDQFGTDLLTMARSALANIGIEDSDLSSLFEIEPRTDAQPGKAVAATVENVVDGDTLHVLVNGRSETVRLVGVDTPESVHADASKNCEEGVIASDYTKSLLPTGTTVYLVRDVSNTDKYDRLLRYVWLSEPPEQPSEADAEASMLNAILVRDGYAQAKVYEPDVAWNNLFARLGNDAAAQGLGVTHKWAGDL